MTSISKMGVAAAALALVGVAEQASAAGLSGSDLNLYGYLSWRLEKVWDEPSLDEAGETVKADGDREISLPSFNVMMQYGLSNKFKVFANLDGEDATDVTVANMWGEYRHNQYLNVRLGKTYRRFGLYNEMLDAVPTCIGIEPPWSTGRRRKSRSRWIPACTSRNSMAVPRGIRKSESTCRTSSAADRGRPCTIEQSSLH